jgi:hypothetical protein
LELLKHSQVQTLESRAGGASFTHNGFHGVSHRELPMTVAGVPGLMRRLLPIVSEDQELAFSGIQIVEMMRGEYGHARGLACAQQRQDITAR